MKYVPRQTVDRDVSETRTHSMLAGHGDSYNNATIR